MPQLTEQMFEEVGSDNPFGLYSSQQRPYLHKTGWYNNRGQWLGYGDIAADDLMRIAAEIAEGEAFILVDQRDWEFKRFHEVSVGFLVDHAQWIVRRGKIFCRLKQNSHPIMMTLRSLIILLDSRDIADVIAGR